MDVRLTPSCCMNEIIQQITERKEPMGKVISWKRLWNSRLIFFVTWQ